MWLAVTVLDSIDVWSAGEEGSRMELGNGWGEGLISSKSRFDGRVGERAECGVREQGIGLQDCTGA